MAETENHPIHLYDQLLEVLSDEQQLYSDMVDVVRLKQDAIVNGKVDELRSIVDNEQNLIRSARIHESKRVEILESICRMFKIVPPKIQLKELIKEVPDIYAYKFTSLRMQLHKSIQEITSRNKQNGFLLNSSLNHIRGMVQIFLRNDRHMPNLYDGAGKVTPQDVGRKVLDCQI